MRRAAVLGSALLLAVGCKPALQAEPAESPPPVTDASLKVCSEAKDPLHPLIVGWPATSRADLETAAEAGPVVVSYAGCVLKVLTSCHVGDAGYESEGTTPTEDRVDIRSARDLHADLPFGAVDLKAKLEQGTHLSLSYVTVGERMLKASPAVLQGDCRGATHYVASMALGAFRLTSQKAASASAAAHGFGATAGGGAEAAQEISGSAGDLATCKAKGFAAGLPCRAVIGLGLRPLAGSHGKLAAAGFGVGIAPPTAVPSVSRLAIAPTGGELARVDLTALELLQAAVTADRGRAFPSVAKARAWDALVKYAPRGAYAELAARRREEWLRRVPVEKARTAQVVSLCPRNREDRRKLDRLMRLGSDVVTDAQKRAYQSEFEDAYAPWPELTQCPELEAAAATEAAWPALHGANDGMVRIPGGTFEMGSTASHYSASPVHIVTVADFEIDATEVTVEAYARCQRAGACSQRGSDAGEDTWRCNDTHRLTTYGPTGGESRDLAPANCMSFSQAEAFCHWAGKRLPTEVEWEYAARGTDRRTYPWGEWGMDDDHRELFSWAYCATPGSENGYRVGTIAKNSSAFGVRDMAGSVWEWTTGRWSTSYTSTPSGHQRVLRGGEFGWSNEAECRSYGAAYRLGHEPGYADSNLGARCARAPAHAGASK